MQVHVPQAQGLERLAAGERGPEARRPATVAKVDQGEGPGIGLVDDERFKEGPGGDTVTQIGIYNIESEGS